MDVLFLSSIVAFLTACLLLRMHRSGRGRPSTLPGPRALPVIGCAHLLPTEYVEQRFREWGWKYGPLISVPLFGRSIVVVNTLDAARDLMVKRSTNYSDRPDPNLLEELGWKDVPSQNKYDSRFAKQRRWMHELLGTQDALANYRQLQVLETYRLLTALVQSPYEYMAHIRKFTVALIVEILYGHKVDSMDDPLVQLAERAGRGTSETASLGSNSLTALTDFFPIMNSYPLWMPGSGFRQTILDVRNNVQRFTNEPFEGVKNRIVSGTASPSFVANLLEQHYDSGTLSKGDEHDIKGTATVLYIGAAETTTTVLASFLLAMIRYPDIHKKAQEEVDRVVGRQRLPDLDDRLSLPYVECILKEIYRFTCPFPLCLPHASVNDDEYKGYHIPGGSTILPNIWAICHDSTMYADPEKFMPERFLGVKAEENPADIIFGFGRRVCPGQKFADANIFLVMANVLATMDVFSPDPADAMRGLSCDDFGLGMTRHPKPFKCCIEPRSEDARTLIEQMNACL